MVGKISMANSTAIEPSVFFKNRAFSAFPITSLIPKTQNEMFQSLFSSIGEKRLIACECSINLA
jgi:hypothetical protein